MVPLYDENIMKSVVSKGWHDKQAFIEAVKEELGDDAVECVQVVTLDRVEHVY